jgi:hypothetical protein
MAERKTIEGQLTAVDFVDHNTSLRRNLEKENDDDDNGAEQVCARTMPVFGAIWRQILRSSL